MPINLAGGYAAGGMKDALLDLVKQQLLQQELDQRAAENQFQRLRQSKQDEAAAAERTYQHGRDTVTDTRQAAQDALTRETRDQQNALARFKTLEGQPGADIKASLGEDYSTGQTVPTTPNPAIPGNMPAYAIGQNTKANPMLINGVKIRPQSMEDKDAAAQIDKERDVQGQIRIAQAKPEQRSDVGGWVGPGGEPVTREGSRYYVGDQEVPASAVKRAPSQRDPGAAEARDLARLDRSFYNAKATLDKTRSPIAQQAERLDRVVTSINQNSPQADALIAPELLTAMAGGQGSGLRMNEAEISRIVGGRTNLESLKAALNKWQVDPSKGLSITPAQRLQIRALTTDMQKKVLGRLDALDRSDEELRSADTVEEHRRIVSEAQKALTDSARPGSGNGDQSGKVDVNSIINDVLSGAKPIKK